MIKTIKMNRLKVNWVGFRDHYHAFIVKPEFETKAYEIKADSDKQLNVSIKPQDKNLAPGESATYDFSYLCRSSKSMANEEIW